MLFGDRMRSIRESKGISRAQLAKKLLTFEKSVIAWENDMRYPNFISLIGIADALDVSLDYLVGRNCDR